MTKLHKTYKLDNNDIVEIWSNPGASPIFMVNGVIQREYYSKWKPWFAWRPVETISGHRVWCRLIYRRYVMNDIRFEESMGEMISSKHYQYGTEFDLLTKR